MYINMIATNKYKCNKMFKKNVKCIPTKCKPTFGPSCMYIYIQWNLYDPTPEFSDIL